MKNCFYERLGQTDLAIADLVDYYGTGMIITRINVPVKYRQQGVGARLLSTILTEADASATVLYLEIQPSDGLNYDQLRDWYGRHGFMPWKGIFRRKPKT